MPKNEIKPIKLTKNQENLKLFLHYGDVKQLAEITNYSISTVYQALRGKIHKIEVWNALAEIVRKRRTAEKQLEDSIKNALV